MQVSKIQIKVATSAGEVEGHRYNTTNCDGSEQEQQALNYMCAGGSRTVSIPKTIHKDKRNNQ